MTEWLTFIESEWIEKYKPIGGGDIIFDFIPEGTNPLTVWTKVDDGDSSAIISGYHFVNRMGYYVTGIPIEENQKVEAVKDRYLKWAKKHRRSVTNW